MRLLKDLLKIIPTWLAATVGWRTLLAGDKTLVILMYHRVLPKDDQRYQFEEPGMVVTPKTFRMHVETLVDSKVPVVSLRSWLEKDASKRPQFAVAITFDDGWLDNYEFAFPILREYDLPSTLFAVSRFLGQPAPFWPNKLLRILLSNSKWTSEQIASMQKLMPNFSGGSMNRESAASIIQYLKQYPDTQIHDVLSVFSDEELAIEMMDLKQLTDAKQNLNVDIGSHTCNHLRLKDYLPTATLKEEISESKKELEACIQDNINGFCFPNGDYSEEALALVKTTYSYAVTTNRGHNNNAEMSPYELVRIGLHEDVSNTPTKFKARLANWF
ncbi:polysaccharide deacetylase family protein [Alteromonas facilis]|uniref:polysaccharide deacetylase family protein n=1 Tax=Alteromonas facilis TaxID=2048004 RepID=UPI000C289CFB|nr:polysaccharide deacetylase family protein [Alteromonas facilis]